MLQQISVAIDTIQVPAKRVKTRDAAKVDDIALDMLENGQLTPVQLRKSGGRYILVEGLHRLEALKALGENAVDAYLVQARQH